MGAIILAGVTISGAILIGPDSDLWSVTTAAWVQAIGSILAILVAVAIPALMRRAEGRAAEKTRKQRARSLSTVLAMHFHRIYGQTRSLRYHIDAFNREPSSKFLDWLATWPQLIDLPPQLQIQATDSSILGNKLSTAVLQALQQVTELESLQWIYQLPDEDSLRRIEVLEGIDEALTEADFKVLLAISLLEMFDAYWE